MNAVSPPAGFVQADKTGSLNLSIAGEVQRPILSLIGNPLSTGEWTRTVTLCLNDANQDQLLSDAGAAARTAALTAGADGRLSYCDWENGRSVCVGRGGAEDGGSVPATSRPW